MYRLFQVQMCLHGSQDDNKYDNDKTDYADHHGEVELGLSVDRESTSTDTKEAALTQTNLMKQQF